MKVRSVLLLCAVLVFALALSPAVAQDAPAAAATETKQFTRQFDIIYHKQDGYALTMEKVEPTSGKNGAAIIMVMSGGWFSNHNFTQPHDADKLPNPFKENAAELLQRGYTLFYVVHGTQPKFTVREILEHMSAAVRHIRHNAGKYGIDPNRIGITGGSAGGHLSLMQGTKGGDGTSDGNGEAAQSTRVQAVVSYFPPTDFVNYGNEGVFFDEVVREVLNGSNPFLCALDYLELDSENVRWNKVTDKERLASHYKFIAPLYHVTKDDAPTLILHGDADKLVPIQQAELIVEEFEEAGVPHRLYVKEGGDHGWPGSEAEANMVADWFDKYLRE